MKKIISAILVCIIIICEIKLPNAFATGIIENGRVDVAVNKDTIESSGNVTAYTWCMTINKTGYVSFNIDADKAGEYSLSVTTGTAKINGLFDIYVNDSIQISNGILDSDSNGYYDNKKVQTIGTVTLDGGTNLIKFKVPKSSNDVVVFYSFSLLKTPSELINEATVDDYFFDTASSCFDTVNGQTCVCLTSPSWINKNILINESGWYGVNIKIATPEENMKIGVSGNGRKISAIADAGNSYSDFINTYVGKIYLNAGNNEMTIEALTGSCNVLSLELGDLRDDIVDYKYTTNICQNSVFTSDGYSTSDDDSSDEYMVLTQGKSFSLDLYTQKNMEYNIYMEYGSKNDNQSLSLYVNDELTLNDVSVNSCESNDDFKIGRINLKNGHNVIKFVSNTNGKIAVNRVKLNMVEFLENETEEKKGVNTQVSDYYFPSNGNSGFTIVNSGLGLVDCVTLRENAWVEYTVYSSEEQMVSVGLNVASAENISFSIYINDLLCISDENIGVIGNNYVSFKNYISKNTVIIPKGISVIRLYQSKNAANYKSIVFEKTSGIYLSDFGIYNSDGVRMPYAITTGLVGKTKAVLKKFGLCTGNYMLVTAQFKNDALVQVKSMIINATELKFYEDNVFVDNIEFASDGGSVKAFLLESGDCSPISESVIYSQAEIFSPDLLNTPVKATLATDMLNNDGQYYSEYGQHDENYDIDAIFYTGAMYNAIQSLVFAYIGIPKGASQSSPVPAVVCVHGGWGKAEIDWVRQWNDRGFAAIAIDMYGDGPEKDAQSSFNTGMKKHPYAGMFPWDDYKTAFLSDYDQAGMYYNIINVINANTLLRSYDCIDNNKIGITGISWGGITTCTAVGVDSRFAFAVPVYGCGYLDLCKTYFANTFKRDNVSVDWDPANFLAKANIPIMIVNRDADQHFSINSSSLSYGVCKNGYFSIIQGIDHSEYTGRHINQVYEFAENAVNNTYPYISINNEKADNGVFFANIDIPESISIAKVKLYYITTDSLPSDGGGTSGGNISWGIISDYSVDDGIISVDIPETATYCYVSITDSNNIVMSSKFISVMLDAENEIGNQVENVRNLCRNKYYSNIFNDETLTDCKITQYPAQGYSSIAVKREDGSAVLDIFKGVSGTYYKYSEENVSFPAQRKGTQIVRMLQKNRVTSGNVMIEEETVKFGVISGENVELKFSRFNSTAGIKFANQSVDISKVGYSDTRWNKIELVITDGRYILLINNIVAAVVNNEKSNEFISGINIKTKSNWTVGAHSYYDNVEILCE